LRVLRAKTTWQYLDSLNGVSLLSSEISHGLNALGTRESGSFNLSREDGKSDFTKITAQATRVQELPYFLQGFLQVTGQYSFTPVLSSEEFGYGGMPNGRGLDPSELTGDHGLSATLEVRYNGLPRKGHWGVIPYSFVDFGKVWQKGVDADNAETSFSTGVGARITNGDSNSIELLMAVPLTKDADNPPPYGNGESPRFLISYSKSF
jgi:hemolysin activation/secretion protein